MRNCSAYEAGLGRRDSLTLWIEDAALQYWRTCGPGGQHRYPDAAVRTSLRRRMAFKLPSRQTEGRMASIFTSMDLTISAPDHTTISRRVVTLSVIRPAAVPRGPLHVLIDSTGLKVCGAVQWMAMYYDRPFACLRAARLAAIGLLLYSAEACKRGDMRWRALPPLPRSWSTVVASKRISLRYQEGAPRPACNAT